VLSFVLFVVAVLLVGGVLFLVASLVLGRGETQPPADPDRSPVELPEDRAVTGTDVRALRITVTARGYRMAEVDWLLDQLARTLDERDAELAGLRAELTARSRQEMPTDPGAAGADPGAEHDA
jgi:DivIVA domain-containing protein